MAFNNGFPMNYPQLYPPMPAMAGYSPQPPMQQQQQQQAGLTWVQGEAGAKSFLVAPNTTVDLWDSEAQVIYLKSADASGMPSMKILDYTIRDDYSMNTDEIVHDLRSLINMAPDERMRQELQRITTKVEQMDD